ncbi:hypothetical protein [Burkholderia cepacia]
MRREQQRRAALPVARIDRRAAFEQRAHFARVATVGRAAQPALERAAVGGGHGRRERGQRKRADDRDPFEKHPVSSLRAAHADARSMRSVRRPRDATRRRAGSGETAIAHGIRPC